MDSREAIRVPSFGWKVKLNHVFPEKWSQNMRPSLKQIIPLIPLFVRYVVEFVWLFFKGRKPIMNFINPVKSKCWSGVPFGGIGGGTIGRGFRGEFCRYQMQPGNYEYHVIHANQFIVTVQKESGETVYQKVLSPLRKPSDGSLSAWSWKFPGVQAEYTALYPRAWTVYSIPEHGIKLTCRQISPVIPNNYKDSSVPGGVFVWSVENNSNELLYVSITFTVKNGTGSKNDKKGGCWNEQFERSECKVSVKGILMNQLINNMPCTYAVSAVVNDDVTVTRMTEFDPAGNGQILWNQLATHGELKKSESKSQCTGKGQQIACAVCARVLVPALSTKILEFSLVWDMPRIHFPLKSKDHIRYYTKYFGSDGKAGPTLSHYALSNYQKWEEDIHKWQSLILDDLNLPEWYKSAIFNELYFVTDGGTIWLLTDLSEKLNVNDPRLEYGRFAYLEGHEYRMYNTYDVHFYASFALSQLWPKLQASIQYEFRDAIVKNISQPRWYLYNGQISARKTGGCMPHDVGEPDEDPFVLINAYNIHDVSEWRDLNLKFVLQCFRDYSQNGNLIYIKDMWPQLNTVMEKAQTWDRDGDGLIENAGFPDQTYDAWTMTGPSAYCGSLWIGALYSMVQISQLLGETSHMKKYSEILDKAKIAFHKKLWNGQYYNFDCSRSRHETSVMADQLSGLWYLRASGVTEEVLPAANVQSALQTIYRLNVMSYCDGKMGAVNGMMPGGTIDRFAVQSEEVWTGVVYALAAFMIHEGMIEEGFNTAKGIYETVYHHIGLGFDTPEALHERNVYRSVGYMRPLSIWAMQLAWQANNKKHH